MKTEPLHRLWRGLSLGALVALLIVPMAAFSQEGGEARQMGAPKHHAAPAPSEPDKPGGEGANPGAEAAKASGPSAAAPILPPPVITHHNIGLDGSDLSYSAKAGMLPLRDAQDKTIANIFYVAYWREPADTKRPITFVFNGGPGAASAYLHLGAIGPKAIEVSAKGELLGPPPGLADNDATWLDFTDLVFVDPVGTGYSRAAEGKSESDFFGVEQDTQALADFIRLYLTDGARMTSPVFLAGESYGGFRAVTIARALQKTGGISPSGLVLISPALEFSLLNGEDYDPLPWALSLPSYRGGQSREQGRRRPRSSGERAARTPNVMRCRIISWRLPRARHRRPMKRARRSAELTGLPPDIVRRNLARISPNIFIKEFDRAHGQVLSRYDGSVSGPDPSPRALGRAGRTPCSTRPCRSGRAPSCNMRKTNSAIRPTRTIGCSIARCASKWDFGTSPTRQGYAGVIDDIQDARAANRALEVLIATGYTDLITPYLAPTYLVNQLPPLEGASPITIEDYAGGHMLYLRPDSRRALKKDVEAMYEKVLKSSPQG